MSEDDMIQKVRRIFPGATIREDKNGQYIIDTNTWNDGFGNVVEMED